MRSSETVSSGERETSKKKEMMALKRRSVDKEPTVWIGKSGATKALLAQINRQLDANELIKVKVHKTSLENNEVTELAGKIAEETNSKIIDVRGRTFTIYKPKKPRPVQPRPSR
jgi:RNA-binding protein